MHMIFSKQCLDCRHDMTLHVIEGARQHTAARPSF